MMHGGMGGKRTQIRLRTRRLDTLKPIKESCINIMKEDKQNGANQQQMSPRVEHDSM